MLKALAAGGLLAFASSAQAKETETSIGLGVSHVTLAGDQADGSGTGWAYRVVIRDPKDGIFMGAIVVEGNYATIENGGDECCYVEDKSIDFSSWGFDAQALWAVGPVALGFEIGVHQFDLRQDAQDEIAGNYGATKLAAVMSSRVSERWVVEALYDYYLPIEEKGGGDTQTLQISDAMVVVGYVLEGK